ncbi:MAG TPA: hypothetical protein VG147_02935 [Solirubrobacteraceae bacterium]|jgi:hypothetical protein|nr:hypothetical protein [Solirubrobacteraceae bacterium]
MSTSNGDSPAARVMNEAIELAIEERSPYPERSAFVDADSPHAVATIKRAIDDDYAIVLVFADCSTRILRAEPVHG